MRCRSITHLGDCLRIHRCERAPSAKPGDVWRWTHSFNVGVDGLLILRCKGCGLIFTLHESVLREDAKREDGSDDADMSKAAIANRLSDEAWRTCLIAAILAPSQVLAARRKGRKPVKRVTAWAKILKGVV